MGHSKLASLNLDILNMIYYNILLHYNLLGAYSEKILISTNPETPKFRLFISNCFELPYNWLSQ